jgi:glycolate oxidase
MFDARDKDQVVRVRQAAAEIMAKCVEMGGSLTGEHGIGIEKRDLMPLLFSADDLEMMVKLKSVFNPRGNLNPAKLLPSTKGCGEIRIEVGKGVAM